MNLFKKCIALFIYLLIFFLLIGIILFGVFKPRAWLECLLLFIIFSYLINIVFAIYIYYSNRNDVRKKTWILFFCIAIILAPFFFLWFGFNPFSKKDILKFKDKFNQYLPKNKKIYKTNHQLIDNLQQQLKNLTFDGLLNGDVEQIVDLEDFYDILIKSIRSAKKHIILNYFILGDGNLFRSVINELKIKKDQGIEIYFIYDWVWTSISKLKMKKIVKELNIAVFKPKKQLLTTSKHNNRNHKKFLIVDGIKAIYGGSNLSDEYLNQNKKYNYWFDTNFILKGDIVKGLINSFIFDYKTFANHSNRKNVFNLNHLKPYTVIKQTNIKKPYFLKWDSYPEHELTTCFNVYKAIIPFIKKELIISTPYLYPTKEINDLIVNATLLGVKVKFLLPGLPDNKRIIVWLNRSLYKPLMDIGAEIYELNGFNHGKYWIIDNDLTLLTSVNFDPRAMIINYESSLLYYNQKFNAKLRKDFLDKTKISKKITYEMMQDKKWKFKMNVIKYILMLFEPAL